MAFDLESLSSGPHAKMRYLFSPLNYFRRSLSPNGKLFVPLHTLLLVQFCSPQASIHNPLGFRFAHLRRIPISCNKPVIRLDCCLGPPSDVEDCALPRL